VQVVRGCISLQHRSIFDYPLADARDLINRPVHTVSDSMPAVDVMRMLDRLKLSAIPVMDEDGKWVATFSISDLKVRSKSCYFKS
jgi:CBS domain-containing protein